MASEKGPFLTTRRSLLGAGVAAVMGGSTLAEGVSGKTAAQDGTPASHDDVYLSAAVRTARWIRSAQVAREVGIAWLPEPDHPDKRITQGPDNTLYSGSAGTVLFFLELARATADSSYLEDARRGADYLAASWEHLPGKDSSAVLADHGLSFDEGLAGVAFALAETWKATNMETYRDAAVNATRALAAAATPKGKGVEWMSSPAVGLGGGIILYLQLYAARIFDDRRLLELAMRGGDRILELSSPDPRGGLRWQGISPAHTGAR